MTTIKINDTYRVEIHNYDFVLIKHGKNMMPLLVIFQV